MSSDTYGTKEGYEIYKLDDETFIKFLYDISSYGREEFTGITFVKPRQVTHTDFDEI